MSVDAAGGRSLRRAGLVVAAVTLACVVLLEAGSCLVLRVQGPGEFAPLFDRFPAQLRMDGAELAEVLPNADPLAGAGRFLTFEYDPAMGYRRMEALQWFGGGPADAARATFLLTFGGSTTEGDNWPRYLPDKAREAGVQAPVVVLNAGVGGYTAFNEKLFFSHWVEPLLREQGLTPRAVLALDGVNDVWYRILSHDLARRENFPLWYSQYHGYHQQLAVDLEHIKTVSGALSQLASDLLSLARRGMTRGLPYTSALAVRLLKSQREHVSLAAAGDQAGAPQEVPPREQAAIVAGFRSSLLDFLGAAQARGLDFVAYLQPVLEPGLYPHPTPGSFLFPGVDYYGFKEYLTNRRLTRLWVDHPVRTGPVFASARDMYASLDAAHPGHFADLSDLFRDDPRAGELYRADAIHYGTLGKERIAEAVVQDLVAKGILKRGTASANPEGGRP